MYWGHFRVLWRLLVIIWGRNSVQFKACFGGLLDCTVQNFKIKQSQNSHRIQETLVTVPLTTVTLATVTQNLGFEKPPYRTFFRYHTYP